MADDTGGLLGFLGRGYDPAAAYGGLLAEPSTEDAFKARALAAMAGAFGQGAMPSPYKGGTPFLATLGQAAQAAYGGQDELIKARNLASESLLRGTQADVARQNLDLNRSLLKARLAQLDAEEKRGGLLSQGPAGLVGKTPDLTVGEGSDPRGLVPYITEGAAARQMDPAVAVKVASTEGLKTFLGDGGRSGGAFQLYVGKGGKDVGLGNQFIADTGLDPRDPKNEKATIDYALDHAAKNGWGAWNGAKAAGITGFHGIGAPARPAATAAAGAPPSAGTSGPAAGMPPALLADVPNYSGALGGPPGAEPPLPVPPPAVAAPALDKYGQPAPPGHEFVLLPNGKMGMRPLPGPGPDSLLGPQPGTTPPPSAVPPVTSVPGGTNGIVPAGAPIGHQSSLLGPQIPEAVAALAQQAGGRPAQFAGPGAADPAVPPGPPVGAPNLVPGGGARPPIAPAVTGRMPPMPPSLLTQPGPAGPPPASAAGGPPLPVPTPGAGMPPMPVQPAPGAAPPALPGGAPTPQQIIAAKRVAAIQEAMGRPVDPITAKIANFNIEAAQAGANAAQTAAAQQPYTQGNAAYDAQVKAQYQVWVDRMKPREIRPGAIDIDPVTGQTRYNPAVVEGTDPKTGDKFHYHSYPSMTPGGVPTLVPIMQSGIGPGTTQTLTQTAAAQPITVGNQVMQKGPGYTEPITTPAGSTIPPASTAAPITGTKPNLDKRGEQFATIENDWGKSVAPAAQAVNRIEAIMSAMKVYETGTWASKKSEIVGMLKSVGINLGNAVDDPAQAQIILKNNFGTALNIMQSTGLSRWTQAELFGAQANSANPDLWAKANHAIGAQTVGVIDWEQQMLKDYRAYKKYDPGMVDPHDFQQRWVEANPLQPFVDRAHERIGPLKGEPAAGAPGGDIPVLRSPDDIKALRPGDRYSRPGDPAGSYRTVPAAR